MSNIPGVSTMKTFWLKRTADIIDNLLVTDDPAAHDLKWVFPRIVFPVALFPVPVLPISTILVSLSFRNLVSELRKKQK